MQRVCGECTLCCTVPAIQDEAVRKAAGVSCQHLCDKGCTIYEERPGICRQFQCLWLEGYFLEGDRPDKHGAMFAWGKSHIDDAPIIILCEKEEGGARASDRTTELINGLLENQFAVVIRNTENVTWIDPDGSESFARIDPSCELKMTPLAE